MNEPRILIRLPNWLGDVVMALPVVRGIQNKYPDAQITLLGLPQFAALLDALEVQYPFIPLPKKGLRYYPSMLSYRGQFDQQVLFTNSERGDMEAFLIGAKKRVGIRRPGKKRGLLTHHYVLDQSFDEQQVHQTTLWENMAKVTGMADAADLTPYGKHKESTQKTIGMICGTENMPEKRWPIQHWRELIEKLLKDNPNALIQLYGTKNDKAITDQVAQGFEVNRLENLAGKTNLSEFIDYLKKASLVICNDTGGMHLANAVGTPVIALFGPTNPVRTGPTYPQNSVVLQPEECPPTGPLPMDLISSSQVFESIP